MRDMIEQLEQYYKENYDTLCKSMAGRVGGIVHAEDVIQEAFCRALKFIDTYDREKSELSTWFSRIARRAMYDFKQEETKQGLVKAESDPEEPTVDFRGLGISTTMELEREIETKKDSHKEVLTLAYLKGYRPREIVEVVDDNIRNVYRILDRFKMEMMEKYNGS